MRRRLGSAISNREVDSFWEELLAAGAIGGKLLGAGGGGFMLAVVPKDAQANFLGAMADRNPLPLRVDPLGARVLNTVEKSFQT